MRIPIPLSVRDATLDDFIKMANRHATNGVGDETVIQTRMESEKLLTRFGPRTRQTRIWDDATSDKAGGFTAIFRSRANKAANNETRDLFKSAVAETFGGEWNIPENVRAAMKMNDYGKGRPLTARRILAVKTAIDSAITAKIRARNDFRAAMKSFGYAADQEVSLAKAAILYHRAVQGACTRKEAIYSACSPTGVANRLMNCGGRFMENVGNFRHGVRLIGEFDAWFRGVCDGTRQQPVGASRELFNAEKLRGFAHFIFADIAHNASTKLWNLSLEELVDFANNPVASFFGRGANNACTATLLQVPPEKRGTIFRAYNALCPRPDDLSDTNPPNSSPIFIARMLKHLDALIALEKSGKTLTAVDVGRTCFPEILGGSSSQTFNGKAIDAFLQGRVLEYCEEKVPRDDPGMEGDLLGALWQRLADSGEEIDHVIDAFENNKSLSNVPYQASYGGDLEMLNGSTAYARARFINDFVREGDTNCQKLAESLGVSRTEGGNELPKEVVAKRVADKIETLCGRGNWRQATAVLRTLSHSGRSNIVYLPKTKQADDQLSQQTDYQFKVSQDPKTGIFTIEYSNTPSDAVKFSWKTTIERNGNTTVTPMKIRNR